jgi:hypothetical protein
MVKGFVRKSEGEPMFRLRLAPRLVLDSMRRLSVFAPAASWLLLASLVPAGPSLAVGEPVNGFPSWYERMIHVLTNRARCDPDAALVACSPCGDVDIGCYSAVAPVQWHEGLNLAARFHATNLTDSICDMQHHSPCNLDPDIGSDYPLACDGSMSCACVSAEVCDPTCYGDPSLCSDPWERLALFGVSGSWRGENIAWLGNPFAVMDAWLLEPMTTATCDFHCPSWDDCNGHRYNILNGNYRRLGVGGDGGYTVQDFWGSGSLDHKIPSGAHYPQNGGNDTEFRANWYDSAGEPSEALVNIDGECFAMDVERGSGGNATYLYSGTTSGCTRYYFVFRDSVGETVSYPDTGSFGIGCADWEETRSSPCLNPPQVPSVSLVGIVLIAGFLLATGVVVSSRSTA